jgi:hypothetical protein
MLQSAYCAATDIAFLQFPKSISFRVRLVHFSQGNVHKVVAVDQMTIERLAVFEFDKLPTRL